MHNILIIDCGSSKVPEIVKIVSGSNLQFKTQKLLELNSINGFSHLIISGAPILLTEVDSSIYLEKAKIIFSNSAIPILGICFGHQLMGLYNQAAIKRCNESREYEEIAFNTKFELLSKVENTQKFMEDHCECIDLPKEFRLIASSKTCENEVMQHKSNPWYGVQFHPESSGQIGKELIINFINL